MSKGNIGSIIERVDLVSNNFSWNYNCIKLSGGYYMSAFKDNDSDGRIVTFAVNEVTGDIGSTIDTWEYNPNETNNSTKIIKVSGTTYAIVYSSSQTADLIYVKTFKVSNAGVITKSFIDSLTLPVTNNVPQMSSDIIYISGNVYAIVYSEMNASLGVVVTVNITSAGAISNAVIDSLDFCPVSRSDVSITRVGDTDFYAIAYIDNRRCILKGLSIEVELRLKAIDDGIIFTQSLQGHTKFC